MGSVHGFSADQGQLAGVVTGVRNRWRLKRALHGATITVAAGFVALALSAYATRALHYGDASLWIFRLLSIAAIVTCAVRFIVAPLRATPRDAQVALYIEEFVTRWRGSHSGGCSRLERWCRPLAGARRAPPPLRARSHAPRGWRPQRGRERSSAHVDHVRSGHCRRHRHGALRARGVEAWFRADARAVG